MANVYVICPAGTYGNAGVVVAGPIPAEEAEPMAAKYAQQTGLETLIVEAIDSFTPVALEPFVPVIV